jgi:hypothetical protein
MGKRKKKSGAEEEVETSRGEGTEEGEEVPAASVTGRPYPVP